MDTPQSNTLEEHLANVFEERAEHLSRAELESWTAQTSRDNELLVKLKGPGAKLLSGPRGSGKSTLLRRAYFDLLKSDDVLAAYVNYSRSLALEPLFHSHSNALQLFRQWVLMKIVVGIADTHDELGLQVPERLSSLAQAGQNLIHALERGAEPDADFPALAPSELLGLLEEWTTLAGRKRCVLFLDDAAHAFSLEQQRDFFEVFRELRSRKVSGKAAVYPGITSYSPNFHVGHEAEVIEAWYRPEDSEYLPMMRSIAERRLPPRLYAKFSGREELLDLLALASFGLPRGYLTMLSQVLEVDDNSQTYPTRQRTLAAIAEAAESIRGVFSALSVKLPRFKHFVEVGRELEGSITRTLQNFNRTKDLREKAVVIAIEEPLGEELLRIIRMLEYAGILRRGESLSKGVIGVFQRFVVHYALLITENALSLGRTFAAGEIVTALRERDAHAFARAKPASLLGSGFQQRCTLDLPPCQKCSSPRVAEDQRFCMKCGAELTNVSVYEELLRAPIQNLPLTAAKIDGILTHTSLRTVQDILMDDEQKILKVPHIGKIWSARIRNYAEEFVSV